ncbi:three-Cys-motif partner protein TcmP [Halococcus saccharolyticus]|nr:three-Cys-motif partner protein TcmP [Halococcus saccharolyticus]
MKDRVEDLRDNADELKGVAPNQFNEFGPWSALKLILHAATTNMYTKVISQHMDDFFYIDALAGSGVSVYGDQGDCFLGSPVIAAKNATEPFTKMYFIENDPDKADALRRRLDEVFENSMVDVTVPEAYQVYEGDANEQLREVVNDMWDIAYENPNGPSFNHFTFIDNQGLDVEWDDGIEKVAPTPTGDLLINFPTSNIVRTAHHTDSESAMNRFYGGNMWDTEEKNKQTLREKYCERLTGVEKEKKVVANVDSGGRNYEYDMIYGTRETNRGSGYIDAVDYVRDFVEAVDGADVDEMLEVIRGDRATMDQYLPDDEDGSGQSSLDSF